MIATVSGDTGYRILYMLHIVSIMVAFAPVSVHPLLTNQSKGLGPEGHQAVMGFIATNGQRIYAMALIAAGVFGFAMQGVAPAGSIEFGDAWFIIAIVLWVAMNGVLHALIMPNERKMAAGDDSGQGLANLGGALITLLMIVTLYLMVFKPGA